MTIYSSAIIITELMMIAMMIHVITYSGFNKSQKLWFILTFGAVMVCAAAEFAVHCGYYNKAFKIPLTILTVIQFSIAPVLSMLFSGALGMHRQRKIALIFLGISFAIEIACAPFGLIFYFDDVEYNRGKFFIIYTILFSSSLLYLMINLLFVGKSFSHRDSITIIMVIIILIAGIVPMAFGINIAYVAIGISASLCYIYYNDLVQQDIKEELVINQKKMSEMQEHIISGLASLIESRDTETGEHVARTSAYVKIIAESAKEKGVYSDIIDDRFIFLLTTLAPMHDVGKIVVSDKILRKPGRLTPEEYEDMKRHASEGGRVIRQILNGVTDEEYLSFASDVATYHHERWDGKGYPKGLKENEIPLSARIMAIADVFDALISIRCYKQAMPFDEAVEIIEREAGTHFDPLLVKVFLDNKDKFFEIDELYKENN